MFGRWAIDKAGVPLQHVTGPADSMPAYGSCPRCCGGGGRYDDKDETHACGHDGQHADMVVTRLVIAQTRCLIGSRSLVAPRQGLAETINNCRGFTWA